MEQKVIDILKRYTRHDHIRLTDRGNSAIFIAMYAAKKVNPKKYILIPDQGGWISYRTYPKMLNIPIKEVPTDRGIIKLDKLKKYAKKGSAFIVSSFAGYFAEQPMEEIAKICHEKNCLVIEDACGSIGDNKLCNGLTSDIIVGSFGRWKPINMGYGGFISANKREYFENAKEPLSLIKVHNKIYDELPPYLNTRRLYKIMKLAEKVKKDLAKYEIFHKDKRGLNVVTEYNDEIIRYCDKNKYPYVLCPTYIRVNEKAISIELKRLDL
ncbi:MAG: DegT/DnrJ/EryC1/StrS family aminotransferase [archaeon]